MAAEKKQKTPTQQVKRLKWISRGCFAGQFLSVAAPFITIGIINFNDYFIQYDGVKMSIASIIAAAIMGLAVWLTAKRQFTNTYITLIVGWAAVTGIFFLVGELINDIKYIMLFGIIGLLGAQGLDIAKAKANKKAVQIQEGIDLAKKELTRDAYKDEVKREEEEKPKKKIIIVKKRED